MEMGQRNGKGIMEMSSSVLMADVQGYPRDVGTRGTLGNDEEMRFEAFFSSMSLSAVSRIA